MNFCRTSDNIIECPTFDGRPEVGDRSSVALWRRSYPPVLPVGGEQVIGQFPVEREIHRPSICQSQLSRAVVDCPH